MEETKFQLRINYKDRSGSKQYFIKNINSAAPDEDFYNAGIAVLKLMGTQSLVNFSLYKIVDKYI